MDSYLIAGPDISTLSRAIRDRQAGNTLPHSQTFQALLPSDGYTNFSGIFYHNIGPVVGPLVDQIKAVGTLTRATATVDCYSASEYRARFDLCLRRARADRGRE